MRPRQRGDANRNRDVQDAFRRAGVKRLGGNRLAYAFGNFLGHVNIGRRQDDDELLATHAAGNIDIPDTVTNALRQLLQNLVADIMAMRIIDHLEEIHINGQCGQRLAAVDRVVHQVAEMGFHVAAVIKPRKRVDHRHFY